MSRQADIQRLIAIYERRLLLLKEQQARHGLNTPPEILLEIEEIETRLADLQATLASLEGRPAPRGRGRVLSQAEIVAELALLEVGPLAGQTLIWGLDLENISEDPLNIRDLSASVVAGGDIVAGDKAESPPVSKGAFEPPVQLLRLDAAVPARVSLGQVFDLAVAVRRQSSPLLNEADLARVNSGDVQVYWPESEPYIRLRLEVSAPGCQIHNEHKRSFRLYKDQDSPIFYFQLTPNSLGQISIVVTVYQEEDWLGSARIQTVADKQAAGEVQLQVTSYPMTQGFHLKNIRALLTEGFTDDEIRRLCYDTREFRPVYEQLGQAMGKDSVIDRLIEYTERQELLEILLARVKELNPAKFEKHQPYRVRPPTS